MITTTQMYWLTRLDALNNLFYFMLASPILLAIVCFVCLPVLLEFDKDNPFNVFVRKALKIVIFISFIGSLCLSFVPTTRDMAAIIIVPKIANSEKVQQAGNKLYDLVVEWMDELKPNKNNNKEGTNK